MRRVRGRCVGGWLGVNVGNWLGSLSWIGVVVGDLLVGLN